MKFRLRKSAQWLLVTLILVSTVLGVSGSVSVNNAKASPIPSMSFFGMNLYVTGLERSKPEKYAMLSAASDLGVQWTREEMSWANIEIGQGIFDWSQYDFWVNALVKQNIKIVGVLETTPSWASGVRESVPGWYWYAPKDPVEYGNYAYEMALRYKGKIDVWELWNEPDVEITFTCGGCDRAKKYADMLREGYNAVKRANPNATVLIGGLSIHDTNDGGMAFLDQVVAASGGVLNFDVLSIHPYMPDRNPENTDPKTLVQNFPYRLDYSYKWLEDHGAADKEIWITEDGYSTCSTCGNNLGVSEEEQARRLIRLYIIAMGAKNVTHFSYFQLKDKFNAGPDDLFGNMGIMRNDLSEKPAYTAYKVLTSQLEGATFAGLGSLTRGVDNRWQSQFDRYHYKFTKNGSTIQVLWKIGDPEEVDVPVDAANVDVITKSGSHTYPKVTDGKVHLTISEDPIFIDEIQSQAGSPSVPLDPSTDKTSPTGFKPSDRFAAYWQNNGGLPLFGYAITPERLEKSTNGKTYIVQWFERARFEYHPESAGSDNEVQLGLLGTQATAGKKFPPIAPPADVLSTCVQATGHCVWGNFLTRWQQLGIAVVGLPISDQYEEKSTDGKTYVVQWFERARFEYHPENQEPYNVLLGLLGKQLFKK